MSFKVCFRQTLAFSFTMATLFSFVLATPVSATIVGDTISGSTSGSSTLTVIDPVIGPGPEFSYIRDYIILDFSDGYLDMFTTVSVSWASWDTVTFTGFTDVITDFNWIGGPSTGTHVTSYGFTDHSIWIDFSSGSSVRSSGLVGTYSISTSQVPEPSALALMGLGLLGFVATRRRRQN